MFHEMQPATEETTPDMTMEQILGIYPGARRTLFQLHHIGGCSSCGFNLEETVAGICARNGGLNPAVILAEIRNGHEVDGKLQISPLELKERLTEPTLRLLDIRTREEFDAVSIPGSRLMSQETLQESMNWPKDSELILIDHTGGRVLDAAAYFSGHGFTGVKGLRGGIDAYALEADPSLPRYTTETA